VGRRAARGDLRSDKGADVIHAVRLRARRVGPAETERSEAALHFLDYVLHLRAQPVGGRVAVPNDAFAVASLALSGFAAARDDEAARRIGRRHGVGERVERGRGRPTILGTDVGAGNRVHAVLVQAPALERLHVPAVEVDEALLAEGFWRPELACAEGSRRTSCRRKVTLDGAEAVGERKRSREPGAMDLESRLGGSAGRVLENALDVAIATGGEAHHVAHAAIICRKFFFHRDHLMGYVDTQLFINGKGQEPAEGKTLPVVNPATGKEIGRVAHAGRADLDHALAAAQKVFEAWRDMVPAERSKIMRKAAGLIRERAGEIAPLLTQEQGKPLVEAKGETLAAADIIEWFAEEGFRVYGRIVPSRMNNSIRQMVLKDPVGPVAAFTPWNFPINQVVRKVGAGLAAGCSMLVKAPEETPAAPAALVKAFADAGIPAGVLQLVYGTPAEISSYLIP